MLWCKIHTYNGDAAAVVAFRGKNQAAGSGFVNKPFNGFQSRKNLWGYFLLKLQQPTLRRTRVGSGILKGVKMSTTFVTFSYCNV